MSYKYFPKQKNSDVTEKYKTIINLSNNSIIPIDNDNKDYQEVLKWVAEGNTIEEADE